MKQILLSLQVILIGLSCTAQVRNSSLANPDTIDVYQIVTDSVNILQNDFIAPGDTIKQIYLNIPQYIHYVYPNHTTGFYSFYENQLGYGGNDTGSYRIRFKDNTWLRAKLFFRIRDKSAAWLDTNDVKARFHADGQHFYQENAAYFVPKWTSKTSIYSATLWIGGKQEDGIPHMAGLIYPPGGPGIGLQSRIEFYAGPVMNMLNYSIYQDTVWNRIWKIRKNEIEEYKANWWNPWYTIPQDILEWPGNGDTTLGQAWHLAPFYDMNGDGIYDPLQGDCPEVRGDECLWFIFNDDRGFQNETMGDKMKIEIHGMAYAFDLPADSAMKTTTFINYKIYNRSEHTFDSTYIGFYADLDIGYGNDDYIGSDVDRSLYYGYNGKPVDGTGQAEAYGANPPVQGVYIMGGPYMDPDGLDNPRYDNSGHQLCDYSVNGRNFSDDVVDNERFGLTGFLSVTAWLPPFVYNPDSAFRYYNMLKNRFYDGSAIFYGGSGHSPYGTYGPATRFMFPGISDSINWGPGCVAIEPKNWTEITANNSPGDRRAIGSSGPFTFHPGDMQEVDIAYVWARDYENGNSLQKLQGFVDQINQNFTTNQLSNGGQFYAVDERKKEHQEKLKVYPNPASGEITLEMPAGSQSSAVQLINSTGNIVRTFSSAGNKQTLNLSGVSSGIYLIRVTNNNGVLTEKVIVR